MGVLRIGIPIVGGPHWMAGVTYVETLARSLQYIEPSRRPELHLVADAHSLAHAELHLPFLPLFRSVILLLDPGTDSAPFEKSSLRICRSREELFQKVDFYYPVIGDAWEQCAASWIPDFQHRYLPDFFPAGERAQRDAAFGRVARHAKIVVLSSETVKRDFRKFYPDSHARTHVLSFFSFTGDAPFRANPLEACRKYGLPERYLLCCNQFWMHKDHTTLFEAISRLRKSGVDIPVVCTGSTSDYRSSGYFGSLSDRMASLGISDQVTILGMIPREDQLQIIRGSCALVQPSLFEGWSSIVEDAKSMGKPIFLSDLDVHKEQSPPDGRFFRAGDPDSLAQALSEGFAHLKPGPDFLKEARARESVDIRMREFGDAFFNLAETAVRSFSGARTETPTQQSTEVRPPARDAASDVVERDSANLRAEAAFGQGRLDEAEGLVMAMLEKHPADTRALNTLGVIQYAKGKKELARQTFLSAVKSDIGYSAAVLNLSDSLLEVGMHKEALGLCYRGLDLRPDDDGLLRAAAKVEEDIADRLIAGSKVRDLNHRKRPYRVSALVSTYKSAAFMRECLEDLEGQTIARDLEIVIVDANSPEGEDSIVEEFQRRYDNIRYVRTPERIGIYPAWNVAVRASSGAFLTPMSTNDRLAPDAYERLLRALEDHPEAGLAYGDSYLTNIPHETFARHTRSPDYGGEFRWPQYSYEDLLVNCRVGPHPLWRRSLHAEVGYFDGRYKAIGDQDFWLRIALKHPLVHIPAYTGLAWITKDSLSGDSSSMQEIFDIHNKHTIAHLDRMKAFSPVPVLGRR